MALLLLLLLLLRSAARDRTAARDDLARNILGQVYHMASSYTVILQDR